MSSEEVVDDELDGILQDALQDFDKKKVVGKDQKPQTSKEPKGKMKESGGEGSVQAKEEDEVSDEMANEMLEQFENVFQKLMTDPDLKENLEKISKTAVNTDPPQGEAGEEFASTVAQTIKTLTQNASNLQPAGGSNAPDSSSAAMSEEDVMQALGDMGLGSGGEDFFNSMQSMVKNLLSKDVLYTPLKEIVQQYPDWLASHKETLEKAKFDNYSRQYDFMRQVCHEYETEKDDDSQETVQRRFQRVVDLMQQMQECGQPPTELTGDMPGGLEFDEHGNPKLPAGFPSEAGDQCSIM